MLLASFLSWWYGAGWRWNAARVGHRLHRASEFFSLALLLKTLFSPYRQISAGGVRGNLTVQWRAFLDRTVSRFVGFFVRSILLIIGTLSLLGLTIGWMLWLLLWPVVPLLPVVMVALAIMGVSA